MYIAHIIFQSCSEFVNNKTKQIISDGLINEKPLLRFNVTYKSHKSMYIA